MTGAHRSSTSLSVDIQRAISFTAPVRPAWPDRAVSSSESGRCTPRVSQHCAVAPADCISAAPGPSHRGDTALSHSQISRHTLPSGWLSRAGCPGTLATRSVPGLCRPTYKAGTNVHGSVAHPAHSTFVSRARLRNTLRQCHLWNECIP